MRISKYIIALCCFSALICHAQSNRIVIDAKLDFQNKELKIQKNIVYNNTSNVSLDTLYFHNWAAAYKNKRTPLSKRLIEDYDKSLYFAKSKFRGSTTIKNISSNYMSEKWHIDKSKPDIIKVVLNKPFLRTIEKDGKNIYQLLAGIDDNKDQSYFLCQLSQAQLAKSLFPIGELTKPEVREIAKEADLITAEKKDSQGLCFIGKVRLPEFLQQKLQPKDGVIVTIPSDFEQYTKSAPKFENKEAELEYFATKFSYNKEDGKVVGKHQGAHYFTKGQRKGLNVGGTKEALYVIETNVDTNIIYTGEGKNHQGLYRNVLFVSNEEIHWIREDLTLNAGETLEVEARIRYRQTLEKATLYKVESGLYVEFENKQSAIQEGQFVAWYNNEELLGSGVIS